MKRRYFLKTGLALGTATLAAGCGNRSGEPPAKGHEATDSANGTWNIPEFEHAEASIDELQRAQTDGRLTARSLTEAYLARMDAVDVSGPHLSSVIERNPEALSVADALDRERKERGPRSPLHGIPILIKDNIATADRMETTAGSLALVGAKPAQDAAIVKRLRDAGAIILGKTNLSEWANFRSSHSTSGWSGRGGQTKNPYALDRNPCGSSSGSGAAASANLCAAAIGTETDGSVVCPSSICGIVGIKPTVGLVSRSGIIPISATQDTAGPMARTVSDAAVLLNVIAAADDRDPATARSARIEDYAANLDANAMKGARIGVLRKMFGSNDNVARVMKEAVDAIKKLGAEVIDPVQIESHGKVDDAEFQVLLYEFKDGLNRYLASLGSAVRCKTLADIIAFNESNRDREMPYFGQDIFIQAQEKGPLTSKEYLDAVKLCRKLSAVEGIDAIMIRHRLDALVAPTTDPAYPTDLVLGDHYTGGGTSTLPAVAGYPHVTVPAGFVFGLPLGISFIGRAWSEPRLIGLAYAFEQATKHRTAPRFLPTVLGVRP
ncbi:MAG TPA: amidase [Acidobacteriota bacterium]|nr:amidase [Acidobacteriota bacterium]